MHTKLSIPERLKDLRVVDKHLTLEQLAEQTGLSKSALSKYESDDYKDISPFAIATCEIATHENFQRLMTDIEIFVDRIADMRIAQMNLVLEATRQEVIRSHSPGDNDLYVRTLELGQVQESDFFSHTIHDDLDSIVQDIRQAHVTDRTTADPQPTFTEVKEKFDRAMQLGSNEERIIHEFCRQDCFRGFLGVYADIKPVQAAEESQQYEREAQAAGIPWNKKEKAKIERGNTRRF